MAMEPQQASVMSKNGTRLTSTHWPFWSCISTSGKNVASKSNLAL